MGFSRSPEALATGAQQPVTPHSQMGGGQGLSSKGHLPIWGDSITIHPSMLYLLGSWPQRGSGGRPSEGLGSPSHCSHLYSCCPEFLLATYCPYPADTGMLETTYRIVHIPGLAGRSPDVRPWFHRAVNSGPVLAPQDHCSLRLDSTERDCGLKRIWVVQSQAQDSVLVTGMPPCCMAAMR